MGSLTVRNLSEDVKKRLRLRAAANGRSMEEEVRLLLAEGAADAPPGAPAGGARPARAPSAIRADRCREHGACCSSSPAASRPTSRST